MSWAQAACYSRRMALGSADRDPRRAAGQLLIAGLPANDLGSEQEALEFVEEIQPWGVILFARNAPSAEAVMALTAALAARHPDLVISIDHEGGRVNRLPAPFTRFPPMLGCARAADPGVLREIARCQGRELGAAGIDVSYAPVLDVHSNPENPVIGDRAFGCTPEEVIHNALPYAQGLAEAAIVSCGKHFPGHGDTMVDSHFDLPRVEHGIERLRSLEMAPFAAAVRQGLPMIMTAHVLYTALDDTLPASLSREVVGGWLRETLGYRGVVVTDDLEMKAVADRFGIGDAAVLAVRAGSDALLVCNTPDRVREARQALAAAIADGRIGAAALGDAAGRRGKLAKRIAKLRSQRTGLDVVGCSAHRELASRLAPNL
jgi:beta-N-acetylhexosaminidase